MHFHSEELSITDRLDIHCCIEEEPSAPTQHEIYGAQIASKDEGRRADKERDAGTSSFSFRPLGLP